MKSTVLKASIVACAVALAAGCASQQELEDVRGEARQAQATANQALQAASTAQNTANQAQTTANEAKRIAEDANSRVDRSFRKSMYK